MAVFEENIVGDRTDEWATPKSLVRPLSDAVGGFDLAASGAESEPHAEETYTEEDDGLAQPWEGKVFCNPPFSDKNQWIEKATEEVNKGNADVVVMVLPVDTSTRWFHNLVSQTTAICFMGPGRVDFEQRGKAGDTGSSPSFAVMLAVFGDMVTPELLGFLNTRGIVYWNRALYRESQQVRFKS